MSLLISLKLNSVLHPQLLTVVISESTSHRHLGLHVRTLVHGQNILPKLPNQHE